MRQIFYDRCYTYLRTSTFWRRARDFRHPKYQTRCRTCRDVQRKLDLSRKGLQPSLVTTQAPLDSCVSSSPSPEPRANWTDTEINKESRKSGKLMKRNCKKLVERTNSLKMFWRNLRNLKMANFKRKIKL